MSAKLNGAIILVILALACMILVEHVNAPNHTLSLPQAPITIEVYNGTESYFNTSVSNVPAGFDVANGSYPGWCVDIRYPMERSPAVHQAILFSSLNPPLNLSSERWDFVNYILNHKQGNAEDIQQAIWYFVNIADNYTTSRTIALAMIEDAKVNGTGFVPGVDHVVAVICYPYSVFLPEVNVQVSIIEVPTPWVLTTDLNGDGAVNIVDIGIVAKAFDTKPGDSRWNPTADVNDDGVVNILDISIVAKDFGKQA